MRKLFVSCCFGILFLSAGALAVFPDNPANEHDMRKALESLWWSIHMDELSKHNISLSPVSQDNWQLTSRSYLSTNPLDPFLGRLYKDTLPAVIRATLELSADISSIYPSSESTLVSKLDLSDHNIVKNIPTLQKSQPRETVASQYSSSEVSTCRNAGMISNSELDEKKINLAIKAFLLLNIYLRSSLFIIYHEKRTEFRDNNLTCFTKYTHIFFDLLTLGGFDELVCDTNPVMNMREFVYFIQYGNFGSKGISIMESMMDHSVMNSILNCLFEYLFPTDTQSVWTSATSSYFTFDILNGAHEQWADLMENESSRDKYILDILQKSASLDKKTINKVPDDLKATFNTLAQFSLVECSVEMVSIRQEIEKCASEYLTCKIETYNIQHPDNKLQVTNASPSINVSQYAANILSIKSQSNQQQQLGSRSVSHQIKELTERCGLDVQNLEATPEILLDFGGYSYGNITDVGNGDFAEQLLQYIIINDYCAKSDDKTLIVPVTKEARSAYLLALTNFINWRKFTTIQLQQRQGATQPKWEDVFSLSSNLERIIFAENSPSHITLVQNANNGTLVDNTRIVPPAHRASSIRLLTKNMKIIMDAIVDNVADKGNSFPRQCDRVVLSKEDLNITSMIYLSGAACSFAGVARIPKPPLPTDGISSYTQKEYFIHLLSKYATDYLNIFANNDAEDDDNYFHGSILGDVDLEIKLQASNVIQNNWLSSDSDVNAAIFNRWWQKLEIDQMPCEPIYKYIAFCSHITKLSTLETDDSLFPELKYVPQIKSGIELSMVCAFAATMFADWNIHSAGLEYTHMQEDWQVYVALANTLISTVHGKLDTKPDLDTIDSLFQNHPVPDEWIDMMTIPSQSIKAKNQAYLLLLCSIYWKKGFQPVVDLMKSLSIQASFPSI
ncbi:MAG: hypothetical protein QS721_13000 [Candidatus Endonucleobacter sp. (ex Gigantidas childressi)]|nr:hypothetical protein [Candidatus Endonucleobacter sp. (ex Gigantidas childressi)]